MADRSPGWPGRVAVAVVRSDPPSVYLASNTDVLGRVLAISVVAQTPAASLSPPVRQKIRTALLQEQWADALALWIQATGEFVDAYPDDDVWTEERLDRELTSLELILAPIFRTEPDDLDDDNG